MKKTISILTTMAMLVLINPVSAKAVQEKGPDFAKGQLSEKLSKDMNGVYEFFKQNNNPSKSRTKRSTENNTNLNVTILDPVNELAELKSNDDSLGFTHIKTQQMVDGIPVYGHEYIVHFNQEGEVYAANGNYDADAKEVKINKESFISPDKAIEVAKSAVQFEALDEEPTTKLYLYNVNDEYVPVYLVSLRFLDPTPGNWNIFVNAENGSIVHAVNKMVTVADTATGLGVFDDTKSLNVDKVTISGRTQYQLKDTTRGGIITTYTAANGTRVPGAIVYSNSKTINDKAAVDAHYYAGVVYDYYKEKFNRNSIDGAGMGIKSTVHYKRNYVNAGWTGTQMIYGDGDGVNSVALSGSLDVIGHEITHGVDEKEADLIYANQSGALNESMSDAFGIFIEYYSQPDKFDWLMGEDVWTPRTAGDALRDISNPVKYGDPDHMSKYVNKPNTYEGDWGGVHTNSGIPNKACYLTTTNPSVGIEKAEQIYYRALVNYFTSSTDFHNARLALAQSAADLYGENGQEVAAVNAAWDAVGVN